MPSPGLEIENNSLSVSAGIAMMTHSYASNSGGTNTLQNLVLNMPQQDTSYRFRRKARVHLCKDLSASRHQHLSCNKATYSANNEGMNDFMQLKILITSMTSLLPSLK